MRWIDRFHEWRRARRMQKHLRWMRRMRVIMPAPDRACERNRTECV
jgi:hypothetical protein